MSARALMLQGTGSDVGKSLLVAGLGRLLHRKGLRVRPFKPQNMSNNAAVTVDGGEIGRAQALQARACGVPPVIDMNPVLLKPQGAVGAQIVVQGRVLGNAKAREFQTLKAGLLPAVLESFARLKNEADLVLVEGAGSASEINLRANDIANMGFARAANVPVLLIGDIDRGGVIASLVGTKVVLDPADAALIRGFLVNKMRGDLSLFEDGMRLISERTGWRALGLIPYFEEAQALPAEDTLALRAGRKSGGGRFRIAVPLTPMIANFDDLDPLRLEPEVELIFVPPGETFPVPCDLVILPGSKATIADLAFMRAQGWDVDLKAHRRQGGSVLGICGGYQMLGRALADPLGLEGPPGTVEGLALLDVETELGEAKILRNVEARTAGTGLTFCGYEIHTGRTRGPDTARPFASLDDGRPDGAISRDGAVIGTYVHGLFSDDPLRRWWLSSQQGVVSELAYETRVESALDALARHLEQHVDIGAVLACAD